VENKKEGFFQQRPKARADLGPRPNPEALRVVTITILAHMQPFCTHQGVSAYQLGSSVLV